MQLCCDPVILMLYPIKQEISILRSTFPYVKKNKMLTLKISKNEYVMIE